MPTLRVKNIPEARYRGLCKLAKRNHRSVSGEVVALLEQWVPTDAQLRKRRKAFKALMKLRSRVSAGSGPYETAEEIIRQDRDR